MNERFNKSTLLHKHIAKNKKTKKENTLKRQLKKS